METVKFSKEDFDQFKKVYELHKESPQQVFEFKGNEFVSGYAKHLIKYLESKFNPQRIVTAKQLFIEQAPSFNFDLDEEQILWKALDDGYVQYVGEDQYLINPFYGEE